jgi:CheY-like chemotaxis protein
VCASETGMNGDRDGQPAEVASSDSVPPVGKRTRHRALLVEDHAPVAEATAELMRFHGLEVRIATNGREALKLAGGFNPVLVLCDLMLPDMTGLDVGQALHATRGANDLLIAVFSAMSADDLREFERQWRPRGIDLFLSKRLTSETLIALLSKLGRLRSDAAD